MNAAIVLKTARDSRLLFVIVVAAIILLETLLLRAFSELAADLADMWLSRPFFRRMIRMMLGADLGEHFTMTMLVSIGFAHPLMYAFTWAFLLATCSRVIVGEIERGTADLLLTLPVSRASVYASVSVVWIAAGVPISLAPWVGVWLGEMISPLDAPLNLPRLAILSADLFALYLLIGAATMCVSSFARRRGPAIAVVLGGLMASFLLNFLAEMWSAAEGLSFLGILHYYRPLPILRSGAWPLRDMGVLATAAAVFWSVGLWRFRQRDVPAV